MDGWINLCVCAPQQATPNQIDRPPIIYPSLPRASKQSKGDDKQVALTHAHARKKPRNQTRAKALRDRSGWRGNGPNEKQIKKRGREIGERQICNSLVALRIGADGSPSSATNAPKQRENNRAPGKMMNTEKTPRNLRENRTKRS